MQLGRQDEEPYKERKLTAASSALGLPSYKYPARGGTEGSNHQVADISYTPKPKHADNNHANLTSDMDAAKLMFPDGKFNI